MGDKELERLWAENDARLDAPRERTQHDVIHDIMTDHCVQILDGKRFGTYLGELLKMLKAEQLTNERLRADAIKAGIRITRLQEEVDRRTPHGLRKEWPPVALVSSRGEEFGLVKAAE